MWVGTLTETSLALSQCASVFVYLRGCVSVKMCVRVRVSNSPQCQH